MQHPYGLTTHRVLIFGWAAVIVLSSILLNAPRTPREICSSQHQTKSLAWEVCVHKLSI